MAIRMGCPKEKWNGTMSNWDGRFQTVKWDEIEKKR